MAPSETSQDSRVSHPLRNIRRGKGQNSPVVLENRNLTVDQNGSERRMELHDLQKEVNNQMSNFKTQSSNYRISNPIFDI